jgi:beta-glucosidase
MCRARSWRGAPCDRDPVSRIETLVGAMTLAEKLGQLTMTAGGYAVTGPLLVGDLTGPIIAGTIGNLLNVVGAQDVRSMQRLAVEKSRLRVPLLIGFDVIHGHRTLFPVPLAEASLFDPATWALTASEAAAEASADGVAMTFAPMLDISRDPRWGRGVEGPGEDPWLAARFAEAKVHGFQGASLAAVGTLAAVAKHYCAYGPVTAGREYASVDISERTVREVHLPAFAAAVVAGVRAVMPAFNDLAGVPMTANAVLLRDWLRGQLGFDGVIVSDYNAIGGLIHHGVAADLAEAAALALNAGVDIDMMSGAYQRGLPSAIERGLVDPAQIDEAVRRVLTLKERLGLFEDPFRRGAASESAATLEQRRRLARTVGARAIVMLKNDRSALPLADSVRRLCLVGPLADAAAEMGGPWPAAADVDAHVSVLAGLAACLPEREILHSPGVTIQGDSISGVHAAVDLCGQADAILLCVGEAATMSGEAASRTHLGLPGKQRVLAEAVLERARALGRPLIALLFAGRPLIVPWLIEKADAVLACWHLGSEAGHAVADVVTGRVSPSGRTPVTWARVGGQIPIFFGQRPSGRPADPKDPFTSKYLDAPNEPLFAFGHGLTYGRFVFSNLRVTPERVREGDTIEVQIDVVNVGARAAEETVFLFAHDRVASVARALLELKGFGKIALSPGERGTVALRLPVAQLRFLGIDLRPVFEPGEVEILAGPCADRSQLLKTSIYLLP